MKRRTAVAAPVLARIMPAAAAAMLSCGALASETVVILAAERDATLFETAGGEAASGAGPHLFAGRVNVTGGGLRRRALVRFALDSIPCGATVLDAELVLIPTGGQATAQLLSLHRCLAEWGEGPSVSEGGGGAPPEPGDATWSWRIWPQETWQSPGGDFDPAPCATAVSTIQHPTVFSGSGLVEVLQSWIDGQESNCGWVVVGNEATMQTTRRLGSRESPEAAQRPALILTLMQGRPADLDCNGVVDGADLGLLLGAWGACPPPCGADLDGSGVVDGADLGALLGQWGR